MSVKKFPFLLTQNEMKNLVVPERKYVWDGILALNRARISAVISDPETGKSTFSRNLGVCVMKGQSFLDRPCMRGEVLFWQCEETPEDIKESLVKLGYDFDRDEAVYVLKDSPSPYDFKRMDDVLGTFPGIRLVVIETLDSLLKTDDIKDNSELRKRMDYFNETVVRKHMHRTSFLALHHFRKADNADPGKKISGATQIRGQMDVKIYLDRTSAEENAQRFVHATVRRGRSIPKTFLNYDPATERLALGQSMAMQMAEAANDNRRRIETDIYQYFAVHPDTCFENQCRRAVVGDNDTKREIFRDMLSKGLLVQTRKANRNHTAGYRIAEIPIEDARVN